MTSTAEQVKVLLDLAGIDPSPAEVEQLVDTFPETRAKLEHLWSLDLADTPPSMVFRAAEAFGPAEVVRG